MSLVDIWTQKLLWNQGFFTTLKRNMNPGEFPPPLFPFLPRKREYQDSFREHSPFLYCLCWTVQTSHGFRVLPLQKFYQGAGVESGCPAVGARNEPRFFTWRAACSLNGGGGWLDSGGGGWGWWGKRWLLRPGSLLGRDRCGVGAHDRGLFRPGL